MGIHTPPLSRKTFRFVSPCGAELTEPFQPQLVFEGPCRLFAAVVVRGFWIHVKVQQSLEVYSHLVCNTTSHIF